MWVSPTTQAVSAGSNVVVEIRVDYVVDLAAYEFEIQYEPVGVCGDVKLDDAMNSVDAALIRQLKAGLIDSLDDESNADVDDSSSITIVDPALILQAAAGLISEASLTCP